MQSNINDIRNQFQLTLATPTENHSELNGQATGFTFFPDKPKHTSSSRTSLNPGKSEGQKGHK